MKVLIISAAFPPMRAGDAYHILYLCQHLADRGLDVQVLTTEGNVVTGNFPFKVYPRMRNWSWLDLPRLAKFVRGCSPAAVLLIHSDWAYNGHPMITFAPTLLKALVPGATFITQFENEYNSLRASIFTRAFLKVIRRYAGEENVDYALGTLLRASDRIIVLSEGYRLQLSERCRHVATKTVVIPPPPIIRMYPENSRASRQRGREALGVKSDDVLIAFFGYIYPGKGIETLLKAFHIVRSQRNNVRLIIIGGSLAASASSCYAQGIYELAKQLGIDDRVTWTGEYPWDSDEASLHLLAADICVLPFDNGVRMERSSLAAAAAHGLPIVTTQGDTLESPFIDQQNVLLCPPKDPKSLALAIDWLISSPELQQQLRTGAFELVREWFSWDRAVEQTIEALQSVV